MTFRLHSALALTLAALLASGCAVEREQEEEAALTFEELGPLLTARCGACHSGEDAEAGYRVDSYWDVNGCAPDGQPVLARAQDGSIRVLAALSSDAHQGVITGDDLARLRRWVQAGAPASDGFVHGAGILDPRGPGWHGRLATSDGYRRMLDGDREDACGRCHDGSPARPEGVFSAVDGATDCRDCHDGQGGALACGTCHGDGEDPLPPRDNCYFPDGPVAGAHDAHLQMPSGFGAGVGCETCHPEPGDVVLAGTHGDGVVDVILPEGGQDWEPAVFDAQASSCTGGCHSAATLVWTADPAPLDCQGCHSSPPADHSPRACNDCHRGVEPDGSGLLAGASHLDGRVDLGDGTDRCGTCHGDGFDDGWPRSGAHTAHRSPRLGAPVACETCHVVPDVVGAQGHVDDTSAGAEIVFSGVAVARGATPTYEGGACSGTACHAQDGAERPAPRWDENIELNCQSCHATPPAPPHSTWNQCQARACHGGEIILYRDGPGITPQGLELHVNGTADSGLP
jgi:predicted CxxxxCH...CXXCH cytochrome family protein